MKLTRTHVLLIVLALLIILVLIGRFAGPGAYTP